VGEPAPDAGPPAWRKHLVRALRALVFATVAFFVVYSVARNWADVRAAFAQMSWASLALGTVAAVASILAAMLSWRAVLADLGHPLPVPAAAQINLVGQLGKYVPGSVWAYVLQMELARRHGVPRTRGFLTSIVATALGTVAGMVVGMLAVRPVLNYSGSATEARVGDLLGVTALALLPVVLAVAHPRVLNRLVGLALRVTRRPALTRPLSWPGIVRTLGWSAVGHALAGTHLWFLADSVATPGLGGLVICLGAMALAITLGTFFVIAPSGFGVRELVLVAALTGVGATSGQALGVAVASRVLFTLADLLAAGGAALVATRRVRPDYVAVARSHAEP
jgi:hypothetical protein